MDTQLENNNTNISVLALRESTRKLLSGLLNPIKLIPSEDNKPRDYRGLAELCGISGELIRSISHDSDPTYKVLKLWSDQAKSEATVAKLIQYLEHLDRFDVVDDIEDLVSEDLKVYKDRPKNGKVVSDIDPSIDNQILTTDDVHNISEGLEPQHYDAFVLFDVDDIDFATKLIDNLEEKDLKLCVKERDLVGGKCEHDAVIKLIAERCRRVIVIVTPAFLRSDANKFFYSFAQSISIEQRRRKIIPCIYKDCDYIPPELNCYFKLDIRRSGPMWNFWDKLRDSIVGPEKPRAKLSLPENSLFHGVDSRRGMAQSNAVTRSVSNSDQHLSPLDLRRLSSTSRTSTHSVKFTSNSMNDLPNTEVPEDNIVPSTSANSLGHYEDNAVRNMLSFFKKFKSIVPKSKSNKNRSSANEEPQINSSSKSAEQPDEQRIVTDNHNNDKNVKPEKKPKKKRLISFKLHKKKELIPAT